MNQDDGSKTGLKTETVDKHEGIEMGCTSQQLSN